MKFIVDAQLPEKLKYWLIDRGYDAIHTNDPYIVGFIKMKIPVFLK